MKTMTREQAFEFLKNKKTMIVNEEQSRKVQEVLLRAGFEWAFKGIIICHADKPYLFTDDFGFITQSSDAEHFKNCKSELILPFDILEIKVEDKEEEQKFKVGDWVLVRNITNASWEMAQFAYCITHCNGDKEYHTFGGNCYCECIPYAGNECLTGNWDLRNSQHK